MPIHLAFLRIHRLKLVFGANLGLLLPSTTIKKLVIFSLKGMKGTIIARLFHQFGKLLRCGKSDSIICRTMKNYT